MKAETEGTVIVRKNNQERPLSVKKAKKRAKKKFEPLVAAVIIMFAAVCVIGCIYLAFEGKCGTAAFETVCNGNCSDCRK